MQLVLVGVWAYSWNEMLREGRRAAQGYYAFSERDLFLLRAVVIMQELHVLRSGGPAQRSALLLLGCVASLPV